MSDLVKKGTIIPREKILQIRTETNYSTIMPERDIPMERRLQFVGLAAQVHYLVQFTPGVWSGKITVIFKDGKVSFDYDVTVHSHQKGFPELQLLEDHLTTIHDFCSLINGFRYGSFMFETTNENKGIVEVSPGSETKQ